MRFKKILCAVDLSPSSREALETAVSLAAGEPIVLIHVVSPPSLGVPDAFIDPGLVGEMLSSSRRELEAWAKEEEGATIDIQNPLGVPWEQIVQTARAGSCDLIVMGTHGRTGLKHALLGSVAEKVARHAHCAVLIVRPR
jgi:nucleotide-binding universal stress UspA family protein